jgi:polyisoprenyl-phosphate glycosyltransferase
MEPVRSGLSVIIPAYNEVDAILETIKNVLASLSKLPQKSEIIVVNDGSVDGTGDLCRNADVRLVEHPTNYGYGKAILSGIDAALYDHVAVIDADGSYPCESLPTLIAVYEKGYDMLVGARQGPYYESSITKSILRHIFRFLAEFSTGRKIPDINSGMRIFRKEPVIAMRRAVSTGFSFTTTVTLLFFLNGFFVGYHPIAYRKRIGSSKVRLTRDALRSFQIIFTVIAQFNPLKLYVLLLLLDGFGTASLLLSVRSLSAISCIILCMGWQAACVISAFSILSVSRQR